MSVELRILKAKNGDCIWLRYGQDTLFHNIIIDSGPTTFKREFTNLINKIKNKGENIDLFVISHIDSDHIGGFNNWLSNESNDITHIKKIWFNSGNAIKDFLNMPEFNNQEFFVYQSGINQQYSVRQGKDVTQHLAERGFGIPSVVVAGHVENIYGAKITVLSPTRKKLEALLSEWDSYKKNTEYSTSSNYTQDLDMLIADKSFIPDKSPFNGSSIAFIFEYDGISLAFLGDAHEDIIIEEKNRFFGEEAMEVKMIKLSHHGSSSNTTDRLLQSIRTNNFIISSNGANSNPDKKTIARVIKANTGNQVNLYCNYNWWVNRDIFTRKDIQSYIATNIVNRVELSSNLINVDGGLLIGND